MSSFDDLKQYLSDFPPEQILDELCLEYITLLQFITEKNLLKEYELYTTNRKEYRKQQEKKKGVYFHRRIKTKKKYEN